MNGRQGRLRLLAIASILGLTALGLADAPAGAATAQPASTPSSALSSNALQFSPTHIRNFSSGLCLGTQGGLDNHPAVQWTCVNHADQLWRTGGSLNGIFGTAYQVINNNNPNQCLGVAGGSTTEGADVVGWNCGGPSHPDQYWYIGSFFCTKSGTTYYTFDNFKSNWVMGVAGGSTAVGAAVVQFRYQSMCNNQFWSH